MVEKSMNNGHIENSFTDKTFTINIKIYSGTFNLLWLNVEVMIMIVYGNGATSSRVDRTFLFYDTIGKFMK